LTVCSSLERLDVVRREGMEEIAWAQVEALPSQWGDRGGRRMERRLMGKDMEVLAFSML
jgi:hypothetical protein